MSIKKDVNSVCNGKTDDENVEYSQKFKSADEPKRRSRAMSEAEMPPPDGGWGWIVVAGSFITQVIAGGIVYSFGLFYVEFLDFFKGGKGETALVGSLLGGIMLLVGPVASALINKYGCRVTSLAGVVIASTGFILSIFAPNFYFLCFSYGIVSGVGFGLIYLPSIVIIGLYFERKRPLALGLSVSGSGIGYFAFSPISQYLIDEFGWRGALLLEAGLILNCAVCSTLFWPLKVQKPNEKKSSPEQKSNKRDFIERLGKEIDELEIYIDQNDKYLDGGSVEFVMITPTGSPAPKHDHIKRLESLFSSGDSFHGSAENKVQLGSTHVIERNEYYKPSSPLLSSLDRLQRHSSKREQPKFVYELTNKGNEDLVSKSKTIEPLPVTDSVCLTQHQDEGTSRPPKILRLDSHIHSFNKVKKTFDFSLLKNHVFLLYVFSNFLTSLALYSPFIFLVDRAKDGGFSIERAKWILSAAGIGSTLGKVIAGYLSELEGLNHVWFYISTLLVSGAIIALCPLFDDYLLLIFYGSTIGLFVGGYVSLTSIVLIDLVGKKLMSNGFGILLMFKGIAVLAGPPLTGCLYDMTRSYDMSYIVTGVVIAFSGVILVFIPLIQRFTNSTQNTDH